MKSFQYVITDPVGIHARPAGLLVKEVKSYADEVIIKKGDASAKGKNLMQLMKLGVKQGETVTVEVTGATEDATVAAIEAFFKANL